MSSDSTNASDDKREDSREGTRTPRVISTFSGAGGSSLGYERAGYDVVAAVDCAPGSFSNYLIPTYKVNHPETPHHEWDVRETSAEDLLDATGLDRGELDILDGSPPCSPFSTANASGEKGYQHDSGTLFDEYQRLVDGLNPRYFVAENVPSLAEGKSKGYFRDLCTRLEASGDGYDLDVRTIDAAYLGSPHHRRRLIFIGRRLDQPAIGDITYESATPLRETLADVRNTDEDVRVAREKYRDSANAGGYKVLDPGQRLYDLDTYNDLNRGFTHRRLDLAKPCPTPTAVLELIHPTEDRYLTIPELRACVGLPDWYELAPPDGSFNQAWECAIRCLPPSLMETVGNAIAEGLAEADGVAVGTRNVDGSLRGVNASDDVAESDA